MPKKYTTLHWIWFWGLITLILAWLTEQTMNMVIFWATIITATLVVVGSAIGIAKWINRKCSLHRLFVVYFESNDSQNTSSYTIRTSTDLQDVHITLRMQADVTLGFINISFVDKHAPKPNIQALYDHNLGQEHPDFRWLQRPNGSWNCTIIRQPHRNKGQRIRIGFKCLAIQPFDGNLEVFLSTEEGATRRNLLPFQAK